MDPQLIKLADIVGDYLIRKFVAKLRLQGHEATGRLIKSLRFEVKPTLRGLALEFFGESYGRTLNTGIPASRVPYDPTRRTGAGRSRYIQGLIRHFRRSAGLSRREATRAAFATATIASRTGHPTPGSKRFSKDKGGKRTGWIDDVVQAEQDEIAGLIRQWVGDEFRAIIRNFQRA